MVIKIDDRTKEEVRRVLSKVNSEVKLHFFSSENERECPYCKDEEEILETISSLNPLIKVIKYPEGLKHEKAKEFSVDKLPALIIHGMREYNVRYFGLPAGYEFGSLIEDIIDVSKGTVDLKPEIIKLLRTIKRKVHIQVFVTPSCPYCPLAVRASHKFAIVNENIVSDAIEAIEFNELAEKYDVYAVPKVIINDKVAFEGVIPEVYFVAAIKEAIGEPLPEVKLEEVLKGANLTRLK